MNRDDMQALLADYLAAELPPAQKRQFEAHLASHPDFAAEVAGLQKTLEMMRSLDPSEVVSAGQPAERGARPRTRRLTTVARYAAAILVGFGVGYAARGLVRSHAGSAPTPIAANDQPIAPNEPTPHDQQADRPSWQVRFAEVYASHPGGSSLARSHRTRFE